MLIHSKLISLKQRFKATLHFLRGSSSSYCSHAKVLNVDPLIIYLWLENNHDILHRLWKGKPLVLLYLLPWCTLPEDVKRLSCVVNKRLRDYPDHRIIFLCNEEHTVEPFRRNGVEALFCNQNAFINENIFTILSTQPKVYDAVYSASMTPYKRFELAAEVSSLMILTYRWAGHYQSDYEINIRALLKNNADWIKDTYSDDDKIATSDMVSLYNQARVGLCLSKAEGGMFASMEYLLCGLPIVTTRSVGGRDSFWDDSFVKIVDDDAKSVAQGVSELIKMEVAPELVRRETLAKIQPHRQRLLEYLKDIACFDIPWEPGSGGGIMDTLDLRQTSFELQKYRFID